MRRSYTDVTHYLLTKLLKTLSYADKCAIELFRDEKACSAHEICGKLSKTTVILCQGINQADRWSWFDSWYDGHSCSDLSQDFIIIVILNSRTQNSICN